MSYILFLIMQLLMAGFMLYLLIAFVTGGPFVPSAYNRAKRMVEMAKIKKGEKVIDLGSGDGRILFLAAKAGAQAYGVEINPYLVAYTKIRSWVTPYRNNIHVSVKNLWTADIGGAHVVFVYLIPWRMEEMAKKLRRELAPGTRVITNSFIFPNWKVAAHDKNNHIYVFKI